MPPYTDILITAITAMIITAVTVTISTVRKTVKKVSYMADAIEDNETNFKFKEDGLLGKNLNRSLNRIKTVFTQKMDIMRKQDLFFAEMLNNVTTGIVAIDNDGQILYSNKAFNEMFGVISIINIRQLSSISPELPDTFEKAGEGHAEKVSFINNMTKMTVSIKVSFYSFRNKKVKIISLNDIHEDLNANETVAWNKLTRVLTHEIMNTVAPISSLSDSLAGFAESLDLPEFKEGIETISRSSKGLIKFLNTYRSLTLIPTPVKKVIYLDDLIGRTIRLLDAKLEATNTKCSYHTAQSDIIIYADESQIMQIILNIINNAIQAGATKIHINARTDIAESVYIDISNNGASIPDESSDEIFVPFYTTKPTGSGIGLSLSRQIMHQHNGNIFLTKSDDTETIFTLLFK